MPDHAPISERPVGRRHARLCRIISDKALTQGGSYRLASGKRSSYFLDMKPVTFDPEGARPIADAILDTLEGQGIEYVGGLEMGAVAIAAGVVDRLELFALFATDDFPR
jgi:orotate phosphoribosyltransferase